MLILCCLLQVPPGGGHRHHLSICLLSGVWRETKTVPVKNIVCSISTMNNKATSWFTLLWVLRAAGVCSPNVRPHFQNAGQLIALLLSEIRMWGTPCTEMCPLNFVITVGKATSATRSVLYQPEWVHWDKCDLLCHSKVLLPLSETEVRPKSILRNL